MSSKSSTKSPLKRILTIISAAAFVFSSVFFVFRLFQTPPPVPQSTTETQSVLDQLKTQEQGYQSVLKREPENTTALQGLVEVRLQMNDLQGAIEPLEKLITIYPEEKSLKELLAGIQQQLATPK